MATGALIEEVAEEVAENLEEAAEITRNIDTRGVGFFLGGVCLGAALGFYFGYRYNREKIRADAFKESEVEVEKIRALYYQKTIAAQEKPAVEQLIEERGYSVKVTEQERLLPAPVPIIESPRDPVEPDWIYAKELAQRTPDRPYVIHMDEFRANEHDYSQVTYTYYDTDDVLTDEDDTPLPHPDLVVGQNNLKWGHGSDDVNIVFVRNDRLSLEMEITRSPGSYEEEILGLEHSDTHERRRRHRRSHEDDTD